MYHLIHEKKINEKKGIAMGIRFSLHAYLLNLI